MPVPGKIKDQDDPEVAQWRQKADRMMDEAVENHPREIDSLLRRFEYRRRYSQTRHADTSDLRRILEIDHSNPYALLNLAALLSDPGNDMGDTSRASLNAARDFLNKSLETLPSEPHVFVSLASIHVKLGDEKAAAETLQTAAEKFPDDDLIKVATAKLALSQHRLEDAEAAIRQIRRLVHQSRYYDKSRLYEINLAVVQEAHADVLEAELLLKSADREAVRDQAMGLLKNIELAQLQAHGRNDVLQHIGMLFSRLNQWTAAIEAIERARRTGIVSLDSSLLLANCYQQIRDHKRALNVYQEITTKRMSRRQAAKIWFQLGMQNLRAQDGQDERDQNWDGANAAFEALSKLAPGSEETFLLGMYLPLAKGKLQRTDAIDQLRISESKFGNSIQYWLLCNDVYQAFNEFKLLQNAKDRLAELTQNASDPRVASANRPTIANPLTQDDLNFLQGVAGNWNRNSDDEKLDAIHRWSAEVPDSVAARFALANLGMAFRKPELIAEAVDSLRQIESNQGYLWKIMEVHQLLASFREGNDLDGAKALERSKQLLKRFPDHPVFCQLAALCYEMSGEVSTASKHYHDAVTLGSGEAAIDGRLRTLVHQRQWNLALELVDSLPLDSRLTSERIEFIVHVLCEHEKFDEAMQTIELAAVNSRQTAHLHYLRAVVRLREPSRENVIRAHNELQLAVKQSPTNLNYWVALFDLEIHFHPELWTRDACLTANRIQWLLSAHSRSFKPAWSSLILAQTLVMRGRLAEADVLFRKTVALEPEIDTRWIPSSILSRCVTEAGTVVTPAIAWLAGSECTRTLAALESLCDRKTELEISNDDWRLQAMLAICQGDDALAIQRLESLGQQRGPGDYLLVASLHDRNDQQSAAREQRLACLREPNLPSSVIEYILDQAMSKDDYELARQCIGLLDNRSISLVERQKTEAAIELAAGLDPQELESRVRKWQDRLENEQERKTFLFWIINFLADHGHVDLAENLLAEAVADQPEGTQKLNLWIASRRTLVDRGMQILSQADLTESPLFVVEMLYQISLHVAENSSHRAVLIDLSKKILYERFEAQVDWTKLAWALERLNRPSLALQSCERALPEDGSPSLEEHYLIWLRAGYFQGLPTAQSDLDRLTREFGPRADFMDSRAVLFLCDDQPAEALKITRALTLHEPLNRSYRTNHRLAALRFLPRELRRDDLERIQQQEYDSLSPLALKMVREEIENEMVLNLELPEE